ncbi:hypothetical protein E2C06_15600 [Dankookia rubra]|uniref:Uncharacterized protein n=1 Tax=Dankookia rubra TaxID=1442381 RepID=A0A4R5QEU9_9PROT|nr:hypothetical protein [Dankookia rubra]TDH61740.1 hypothetical protein E2C06_15600 [Dankookia rubra]
MLGSVVFLVALASLVWLLTRGIPSSDPKASYRRLDGGGYAGTGLRRMNGGGYAGGGGSGDSSSCGDGGSCS